MRVARLHGTGDIRLSDEPVPVPEPGSSLIRVTAVGLCGSDLHWFSEGGIGDATIGEPLVLGHEFAGVVQDGPLSGRRVAVDPAIPCHTCEPCLSGNTNLCLRIVFAGHGRQDGALREYLTWPDRRLHPLPEVVSDAGGAVLEPLGVAVHAHDLGHVRVGATVAVVGCGPIGLLLIQVALAAGAAWVLAVEPLEHRRAAATRFGAVAALTPAAARDGGVAEYTDGRGVDVAFDVSGSDDAVHTAMEAVRPGARVVLAGIPDGDNTAFPASLARRKGLTLVLVRRMKEVYPRAIQLVASGRVDVESVISDRYPLVDAAGAFGAAATRRGLKVIVEP
jgi:L-iditol 2-dehydrogenase